MAVQGIRGLNRFFRRWKRQLNRETRDVLENQAQELFGRSVALVPELERHLLLSGKVTERTFFGRTTFIVSYDTPYALIRHEDFYNLGPISSRKAPTQDGEPGRKYLERPYQAMIPQIKRELAKVFRRAARKARR